MSKSRIYFYFFFFGIIFYSIQSSHAQSFALIELFTSEGCSSCPPADALLSQVQKDNLAEGKNIITLAYHVDYWNKYGWKDPYSKMQFSMRQENYSRVIPGNEMYTPQAIINGRYSFVGSDKKLMKSNIETALSEKHNFNLNVNVDSTTEDSVFISYKLSEHSADNSLRLVLTEDGLSNSIKSGENSGKTLKHDGVVRYFYSINSPASSGTFTLPRKIFSGDGKKHVVAFIQQKKSMTVLAAIQRNLE